MSINRAFGVCALIAVAAAVLIGARLPGENDIGGVVTGPRGPEAGVWVIAETSELPTKFVRIVVTDDQGRYLIPDLPKANYDVWVRGYGLVDSPKSKCDRGKTLDLDGRRRRRTRAPRPRTIPPAIGSRCSRSRTRASSPGTGPTGNGISPNVKSQGDLDPHHQVRHVHGLPPARQQGHARDP